MGKLKQIAEEWEDAFPFEQEYQFWIASVEQDFREECAERAKLVVTNKTNILLHKDNTEIYSPYSTVNS